jgi:hypothetical protein
LTQGLGEGRGGAIAIWGDGFGPASATFITCEFYDNESEGGGGGLGCHSSYDCVPSATLTDCVFVRNNALDIYGHGYSGGAVDCSGGSATTLINCTLYGNSGERASGIECRMDETALTLQKTIIVSNLGGPAVLCDGEPTLSISCSDIYGNQGGDWVGCIAEYSGLDGNIWENPAFCDPEGGDYRLFDVSTCAGERDPTCGLIGALGVGCDAPVRVVHADGSGNYPTIQAAIDAPGGAVIVELTDGGFIGVGNREVDFRDKAITVRSQSEDPTECYIRLHSQRGRNSLRNSVSTHHRV